MRQQVVQVPGGGLEEAGELGLQWRVSMPGSTILSNLLQQLLSL